VDRGGTVRAVELSPAGIAASLAPVVVVAAAPVGLWRLCRGGRRRRWEGEGRCFTCGYELGSRPEPPAAAEGSARPDAGPAAGCPRGGRRWPVGRSRSGEGQLERDRLDRPPRPDAGICALCAFCATRSRL